MTRTECCPAPTSASLSPPLSARQVRLSPLTVKTHVNHAMTKPGARDRAQLVVFAYQTGLARALRPWP
jgi:DNA-binding CsgD family transcriptional regulator